jgi:hypothetical protein
VAVQLRLTRSQEQGGRAVVFALTAKVLLNREEAALINRYGLTHEVLAVGRISLGMISKQQMDFQVRVGHLLEGYTQRFEDLGSMLDFEERMKDSCYQLVRYIDSARKFSGDETVEIRLPSAE